VSSQAETGYEGDNRVEGMRPRHSDAEPLEKKIARESLSMTGREGWRPVVGGG